MILSQKSPKIEYPGPTPPVSKSVLKMSKTFITIPVCGQPFIEATMKKNAPSKQVLKHLYEATESTDVCVIGVPLIIHPMFIQEHARWAIVGRMIRAKQGVRVWAVTDVLNYSTNAAIILTDPRTHFMGCPHLMGTVILELTDAAMAKFCPDADMLRTVEVPEEAMEDDVSMAEYMASVESKGYDTSKLEFSGQVFMKAAVA